MKAPNRGDVFHGGGRYRIVSRVWNDGSVSYTSPGRMETVVTRRSWVGWVARHRAKSIRPVSVKIADVDTAQAVYDWMRIAHPDWIETLTSQAKRHGRSIFSHLIACGGVYIACNGH